MSTKVIGRHFLFHDTFSMPELYWSSEAADEAERSYAGRGILVRRWDFPLDLTKEPGGQDALAILAELNDAQRDIYALFLKLLSAESRWRNWLLQNRPSETT